MTEYSWDKFIDRYKDQIKGVPLVEILEEYHKYAIDEVVYKLQQCQMERNALLKTIQLIKEEK